MFLMKCLKGIKINCNTSAEPSCSLVQDFLYYLVILLLVFLFLLFCFFFFKAISSVCVKANVHLQEKEKNNICRSLLGSSLSFFETATVLTE